MKLPSFITKKRIIIAILLAVVGYGIYSFAGKGDAQPVYETAPVEKRDLVQSVEVTGELKPAARIELTFKNSGTIRDIFVKTGDKIEAGTVLAELKNDEVTFAMRSARASLSIAEANLNARLAGETTQALRVAETQVEQARAAHDKAIADLASTKLTTSDSIRVAELNVQTAKNNLENQDATLSQTISNAYESARTSFLTALGPLQTGLVDGDQISGVDNSAANQTFLNTLGILDAGSLERAKSSYLLAKAAKQKAEARVKSLSPSSSQEDIQSAGSDLQEAIRLVQAYLGDIQKVLAATIPSVYLTSTELTTKKATIDTDRTAVSTQNSTVLSGLQAIKNAELGKTQTVDQLKDAYQTAVTSLDTAKVNAETQVRTAETNVAIQKAALDSALATLDLKRSPPRAVDVAGLRAAVDQARVAYDKAAYDLNNIQIIAPVDGTIAEVVPDVGEQISPTIIAIRLVGTSQYDIEALVPEADIAKIEVGQTATITLDAYGDDMKFSGTVTAEDPDQTKVQDAVYYKIRVQIDPAGKDIKPGMTANVTIKTGERKDTLVIPLRAVRTRDDGKKTVRIMENGQVTERVIELGLRGDEGTVEVTTGLNKDEQIVVGEQSAP